MLAVSWEKYASQLANAPVELVNDVLSAVSEAEKCDLACVPYDMATTRLVIFTCSPKRSHPPGEIARTHACKHACTVAWSLIRSHAHTHKEIDASATS